MSNYKTLSEMGILNPSEINKYRLRQTANGDGDILTIYYKRKSGSILPYSRKYNFTRSPKSVVADSGRNEIQDVYEISTFLQSAITELDSIVTQNHENTDRKQEMLQEIEELELSVARKLGELKSLLKQLG